MFIASNNRKDVRLPVQLQRAMAIEASAVREARAKVIAAEGEHRASKSLKEAALVMSATPEALQLRYLQTLNTVANERTNTILFPVCISICVAYNNIYKFVFAIRFPWSCSRISASR